jgi:HD superfamily phosphohydrolase
MDTASTGAQVNVPGIGFRAVTTVRDALYDRIPLAEPELALIGTAPFLRLERIQQLGFVSRVWPGARHTRSEHSLGVFHLARLALAHLRATPAGRAIGDEDARALAAAALLHDIGHYPFSHAIEELGPPIVPHEQVGAGIITRDPIAAILHELWGVEPERVAAIVAPSGRTLAEPDRMLRGLLSGPLDVDKLDYLPRDARACHVPYGGVDTWRLLDALRIAEIDGRPRIVVDDKGVSPLHSLINARQEMFDNVYWHHTNRACMAMLLRAVQEAMLVKAVAPDELTSHDDASLLTLFAQERMPEPTRRLTSALRERRIHKRAVEVSARAAELYGRLGNLFYDPDARRQAELGLAEGLSALLGEAAPPEAILIDIPKPERWGTDVWVAFANPPVGFQPLMPWREVAGLGDPELKRYEEHRRLVRIVTEARYRETVAANWEALVYPILGGVV